jgi:hypothetical protein
MTNPFVPKKKILILGALPFLLTIHSHHPLPKRSTPMFRPLSKSLLLLLFAAVVSQLFAGGEKLRYQMAKGSTYRYTLTAENNAKAQAMGQEFNSSSASTFGISLAVEDVGKDGELTCIASIDKNTTSINSPMMKDSALVIKEINGKRTRLTISPLGKTLSSTQIDTIQPSQTMAMLGNFNVADLLRRLLLELPEQPVGTGDTWKKTTPETLYVQGLKLIMKPDIQYKIEGTENVGGYDCVKIAYEGTASQYGTGSRQGIDLVLDGTVKTKGSAYFAQKEGILVSIESTSGNDMTVSGTGEQMFTQTQSVTSNSKMVLEK